MQRYVTSHGIGLNVKTDLDRYFRDKIVACGLEGKDVTSMEEILRKEVKVDDVVNVLAKVIAEKMEVQRIQDITEDEVEVTNLQRVETVTKDEVVEKPLENRSSFYTFLERLRRQRKESIDNGQDEKHS